MKAHNAPSVTVSKEGYSVRLRHSTLLAKRFKLCRRDHRRS